MCSSGAFLNFGHSVPTLKASKVWLNKVPAYAGVAAVDCYIGATEPHEDDPLNKVYPGEFNYGGGHVIQDLVAGKKIQLKAVAYGTDCYPNRMFEKEISLRTIPNATLCNPRNGYQNYNCAINLTNKTIYTYMGVLKPKAGNANYCSAGQLSPLFNDPYYKTIGLGTRIFLGGGQGYVTWHGTQHKPRVKRTKKGMPLTPAGTLWVMGDMKKMSSKWLVGLSILGYGCSLAVGLGIPIPILNEDVLKRTCISDREILAPVIDYSNDYPQNTGKVLCHVSYEQLRSGQIEVEGKKMVGSAQKRVGSKFIQHGSIPLEDEAYLLESVSLLDKKEGQLRIISLSQALDRNVNFDWAVEHLVAGISEFFSVRFIPKDFVPAEREEILEIQASRYENNDWTFSR